MLAFRPLTWEDREPYTTLYRRSPVRYAEYSFFSLWGWLGTNPLDLAWEGELCWLRSHGHKSGFCAPIGNWDAVDWESTIDRNFVPGDVLQDVPEAIVERFPDSLRSRLHVEEDRDEWEYLHSVSELVALEGGKFAQKRGHVRSFLSGYDWEYLPLLPEDFPELLAFQSNWRRLREEGASLDDEDLAIRCALERWDDFPLFGALLKVDGAVIGYTIAEELDEETLDIRFEKALPKYAGSYQALNQLFLKHQGSGYTWVNREEDMGDPGLRAAKLSYHPVRLLKKYRVTLLGQAPAPLSENGSLAGDRRGSF